MPYKTIFNRPIVRNQSMASTVTSDIVDMATVQCYMVQARYTGSPNGTAKLQVTNTPEDSNSWDDMADSALDVPSSNNLLTWNVGQVGYDALRLVYTPSGGSGTLNATINAKGDDNA